LKEGVFWKGGRNIDFVGISTTEYEQGECVVYRMQIILEVKDEL